MHTGQLKRTLVKCLASRPAVAVLTAPYQSTMLAQNSGMYNHQPKTIIVHSFVIKLHQNMQDRQYNALVYTLMLCVQVRNLAAALAGTVTRGMLEQCSHLAYDTDEMCAQLVLGDSSAGYLWCAYSSPWGCELGVQPGAWLLVRRHADFDSAPQGRACHQRCYQCWRGLRQGLHHHPFLKLLVPLKQQLLLLPQLPVGAAPLAACAPSLAALGSGSCRGWR
mmetsp:Transcript_13966/g.30193  ORF Transcript_13966/g.30193 Transcript_13966/m.30193 type:complete len:221 (+) Transcript_13966:1437-2099(+)